MVELTKYLESVTEDRALRLNEEKVAHNLEELYSMIESSGPEVFYMHVNDMNNDVANWTRNSIGYNELADKMLSVTDRDDFLKLLSDSINNIKNPPKSAVETLFAETPPLVTQNSIQQSNPIFTPPTVNISAPVVSAPIVSPAAVSVPVSPIVSPSPVSVVSPSPVVSGTASSPIVMSFSNSNISVASAPVAPVVIPQATMVSSSIAPSVNISQPFSDSLALNNNSSAPSAASAAINPVVSTIPVVSASVTSNSSPIASVATPQAPIVEVKADPKIDAISAAMSFMSEERFDFEDIFNILLYELEQEVLVLDS